MTTEPVDDIKPVSVIEEISQEEYNRIIQNKTFKYNPGLTKRVFVFGVSMLSLVVIIYILLISFPDYALWTSITVLGVMCGCMIFFVWNEMTYHHHTIERYNYEYHKTPTNIISNNNDETIV